MLTVGSYLLRGEILESLNMEVLKTNQLPFNFFLLFSNLFLWSSIWVNTDMDAT
jgi:hypothetical protein